MRVFHTNICWWSFTGFEWRQVSSSLEDSSQYSTQSLLCCSVGGPHLSSYFLVLQSVLLLLLLRVLHISVSWWFFTGGWMTASLLKSSRLFLLSILSDLNNAVIWMVSICPLISRASSLSFNALVTVLSAPLSCSIVFFSSLARSWCLSLFSLSFSFTLWSAGMANSTIQQTLFLRWLS